MSQHATRSVEEANNSGGKGSPMGAGSVLFPKLALPFVPVEPPELQSMVSNSRASSSQKAQNVWTALVPGGMADALNLQHLHPSDNTTIEAICHLHAPT